MSLLPASASRAARFGLVCALAAAPAWAEPESVPASSGADALSQGLIRLRGEVEQLNSELELLREEQRTTLAGLNAQKAELGAAAERQQLALREARQKLDAQQAASADAGIAGDALKPAVLQATRALSDQIRTGLPFKIEERLGELDAFRTQVENGSLPPQRAVNRLWAFYEDEFRLTRENSLHQQTIALGNERVLAQVAKLGGMALYFKTDDGRVGQAQRAAAGWQFAPIEDEVARAQVLALFDALGKQIRQGFFELPLAAAGSVR
jgi:hypothetical protein